MGLMKHAPGTGLGNCQANRLTFGTPSATMLDRPLACYRVEVPALIAGLPASTGDLLIFWPGHPTHTLALREWGRGSRPVRRFTHVDDGIVYGLLLELLNSDVICPLTFASAAVVTRPAQPTLALHRA
jgi:hypothetical protein